MCIFSGAVTELTEVKLLASVVYPRAELRSRKTEGGRKPYKVPDVSHPLQLTLISLTLELPERGTRAPVLVLPFPLRRGRNRVKLFSFSENYPELFSDLDLIFPAEEFLEETEDPLLGAPGFRVSVKRSFKELFQSPFGLSPEVMELLEKFYSRGFGFVVCEFSSGQGVVPPFGYYHELSEDRRLFLPTRSFYQKRALNPFLPPPDPEGDSLAGIYSDTLGLEDRWMSMYSRRRYFGQNLAPEKREKEREIRSRGTMLPDPRGEEGVKRRIYLFNSPGVRANPLLRGLGVELLAADPEKLSEVFTYLNSQRLPQELAFGRITTAYRITLERNYRYNHDFLL